MRRALAIIGAAVVGAFAGCDDSPAGPPTSKKINFQLSAEVGGGEAGRSIGVRAYYLRNGDQEVDLDVEPSTFAVSAATATGTVSVEVLPCLNDANREGAADGAGRCRVHLEVELRASNGVTVSEDEAVVMVTPTATSLIVESFTLPSGALVPSSASVELVPAESGQLPAAVTVDISPSGALQPGTLSAAIEYVHGTGWLSAVIPAGEMEVTIVPTTTTLAPGRYEAIVRITSAWMFTPTEIRVAYVVPHPPRTVTITGAGNGTGLVLVTPNNASCTTSAGELSGFCAVPAAYESTITLTPAPAVGSGFTGWSGACQGTEPCSLVMDQHRAVTATFMILKRDLTVDAAGTGSGTITSTPAGISCIAAAGAESGTCAAQFDHPTQVTLTATPNSATSTFTGWSGACQGTGACVVTMTEARAVTATFALIPRQLVVSIIGGGAGTVTSVPEGISCSLATGQQTGVCTAPFDHGTPVELTATPSPDMVFTGWSGACTGTGTCTVTMDAARTVTASFVARQLTVTMAGGGAGTVTSSPEGIACTTVREDGLQQGSLPPEIVTRQIGTCRADFAYGTPVVLTVTPGAYMRFTGWGGACSNTEPTCTVTMDAPRTVTANIVPVLLPLTVQWRSNSSSAWVSFYPIAASCSAECVREFPAGTIVQVEATQQYDIRSSTSLGGCLQTGSQISYARCVVRMDGPKTISAYFSIPTRSLSVVGAGTGSGLVTSVQAGINCTIASGTATGVCFYQFSGINSVVLTATPAPGSTFSGWVGCIPFSSAPNTCSAGTAPVTARFDASPPPPDPSSSPIP